MNARAFEHAAGIGFGPTCLPVVWRSQSVASGKEDRMRIMLVDPNITGAMTDKMVAAAQRVIPYADVLGVTARHGVAALEGCRDHMLGAAAVIEETVARYGQFDGPMVSCFGGPGLSAARELTAAPVVGIAEASFLTAMTLGERFSVLTSLKRGVP